MRRVGTRAVRVGLGIATAVAVAAGAELWLAPGPNAAGDGAEASYRSGRYEDAARLAAADLRVRPDDPTALRLLARSRARLGEPERAQPLYGRLPTDRMEGEDYYLLGLGLSRRGQFERAAVVLERARSIDPGRAETLAELARLYARSERLRDALDAAESLAARPGWEARGGVILGVLRTRYGDPAGAASAFQAAMKADPALARCAATPAEVARLLARAWLQAGRPDLARSALADGLRRGDPESSWLESRALLQQKDATNAAKALERAGRYGEGDPSRAEPAAYVGAASCARCHAEIHGEEQSSRHARTFATAEGLRGLSLPDAPVRDPALPGTSHGLRRDEGGSIHLTTRAGDKDLNAVVEFALGSGDRGLTMVARDGAGRSRVCRVSAYRDRTLWDLTSHAAPPHPDDPLGALGRPLSEDAVETCVECHVTSRRAARDRTVPEAADRGIGCERCHGPGGNHLSAVALSFPDPAIGRPSNASADQVTRLCGACHKSDDPAVLDADPRAVRFQATTLPKSRCYTESLGALSCTTCHNPHRDAETSPAYYEAKCLSCHGPGESSGASAEAPRVPCPVNPARDCLSCHMPRRDGAAPHSRFTDHQIRVQAPGTVSARPSG